MNDQGLRLLELWKRPYAKALHRPLPENDVASLNQSGIRGSKNVQPMCPWTNLLPIYPTAPSAGDA